MSVKMRQLVEKEIATAFIKEALKANYSITVYDSEEDTLIRSKDKTSILKAMFTSDDDRLYLYKDGAKDYYGWVWFIYGNDGWDVISDYTTNLDPLMPNVNKVIDKYED